MALAQDAELSELYFRGLRDYPGLTDDERGRFDLALGAFLTNHRNDFALAAEGLLSTDLKNSSESVLNWFATQPGFAHHYWPAWRSGYPPEFAAHVDGIIANSLPAAQQIAAADSARAE